MKELRHNQFEGFKSRPRMNCQRFLDCILPPQISDEYEAVRSATHSEMPALV